MAEVIKNRPIRRCPPRPSLYPWLVFFHGKKMENQTFYCLFQPNTKYVRSIPELKNKRFCLSSHGWLVLLEKTQFHLWNPKTLESIYLPPLQLQPKQCLTGILLTSSPTNPDSTLLLFFVDPQSIMFCCIKDQTWFKRSCCKDIKSIGETDFSWDNFCLPIVCDGRIYATTACKGKLVEIEIMKQSLDIRPLECYLPFVQSMCHQIKTYLVESDGDVFVINFEFHCGEVMNIVVFKFDFSTKIWNRVDSCPDRAFFLSNGEAISCRNMTTDIERIGNRVYFTRYQDKSLYSYHIEDKTISMSSPCPDLPTPWSTPIWVFPDPEGTEHYHQPAGDQKKDGKKDIQVRAKAQCETEEKLEEANRTSLNDLCVDVGKIIAGYLSPLDYMNFRAVSQWCRSVAAAKQWRCLSPVVELEKHILSPWLMLPSTIEGVECLVDPRLGVEHKYNIRMPQVIEDAMICYSKDGWLLMSRDESWKLYNPLTKSIICLPDSRARGQTYYFSSLPNSSDCIVVAISLFPEPEAVSLTRPGMSEWIAVELCKEEDDGVYFRQTHFHPVFLHDCFYFLGENDCLGVVKLENSYATLTVHKLRRPCSAYDENFLVECGGEILAVFVGKAGGWLQVFRLNQSAMAWEEVKSLGEYSLYLCSLSTVAAKAKTPGMENKIYFPRFYDEMMVFYSLETGKFHSSKREYTLVNYCGTKKPMGSSCCWIEPRWCLEESTHSSSLMLEELIK